MEHRYQYKTHRRNTKGRKDRNGEYIKFNLTYEEWLSIWVASGHLTERGCGSSQYVMSRINDEGDYSVGNVEIITNAENVSRAHKGRTRSIDHAAKIGAAHKGIVNKNRGPVTINGVDYKNRSAAAKALGVSARQIYKLTS